MLRDKVLSKAFLYIAGSVFIVLLLWLLAIGCQKRETPAKTTGSAGSPINLMVPLHQVQPPPAELMSAVEQATDAKLEIEWIPNDIYRDKLINALETNSLKQVTFVAQNDYVYVKNAIRSGQFWEIGPYLPFYPNLSRLNASVLADSSVDGKTFALYAERPSSRQGVIVRKDWLDKLKLKPPETVDELYNVLKQFTYGDPDGNGIQDTIGLADRGDLVYGAFKTLSSYFGTPNNWALAGDSLVPEFKTAEYADTMNFMKKLFDERIVNPDFPVTSKQVQRYMLISGKAGSYIGNMEDAPRLQNELRKFEPQAELMLINRIRGPHGYGVWSMPSYSGLYLFSKSQIKTEEELRRVLQFFDRSMNPEAANLLEYGLEHKHYALDNGQVVITPAMSRLRETEVLPLSSLMIGGISNAAILKMKEDELEPLAAEARRLVADNDLILIKDAAQRLSSPTYDAIGAELGQLITNATYNYMLGKIDLAAFNNEITAWEKKGGAAVTSEYAQSNRISRKQP